jgi:hypothetical protein
MGSHCQAEGSHIATDLSFGLMKQQLRGRQHHNYEKVQMVIHEYLRMYGQISTLKEFFKLSQVGINALIWAGIVFKSNSTSQE